VLKLIYLCAFFLTLGDCLESALGGALQSFIHVDGDRMCVIPNSDHRFYHNLTTPDQIKWADEFIKCPRSPNRLPSFAPFTFTIQSHTLFCEDDFALLYEVQ
ncbi:uncharacterized protein BDR25DRAFT_210307, partial [Lindgomyces ingoldianus]